MKRLMRPNANRLEKLQPPAIAGETTHSGRHPLCSPAEEQKRGEQAKNKKNGSSLAGNVHALFLSVEICDAHAHQFFDDHDFSETYKCSTDENSDVFAR